MGLIGTMVPGLGKLTIVWAKLCGGIANVETKVTRVKQTPIR